MKKPVILIIIGKGEPVSMSLNGYGVKLGASPAVYPGFSGFDTAPQLIKSIDVSYE